MSVRIFDDKNNQTSTAYFYCANLNFKAPRSKFGRRLCMSYDSTTAAAEQFEKATCRAADDGEVTYLSFSAHMSFLAVKWLSTFLYHDPSLNTL